MQSSTLTTVAPEHYCGRLMKGFMSFFQNIQFSTPGNSKSQVKSQFPESYSNIDNTDTPELTLQISFLRTTNMQERQS